MFQVNSNAISAKEKTRSSLRSKAGEGTEEKHVSPMCKAKLYVAWLSD